MVVSGWWGDLTISLPRSGSAAPIFYDRVPPEPALAAELVARLAPGGVFVDVGAHIGVYSLIAAKVVGPTGRVFAIEPQAACLTPLQTNASANGLTNIVLIPEAASDHDGATQFTANPRSMRRA